MKKAPSISENTSLRAKETKEGANYRCRGLRLFHCSSSPQRGAN